MRTYEWRDISRTADAPAPTGDGTSAVALLTQSFYKRTASIREYAVIINNCARIFMSRLILFSGTLGCIMHVNLANLANPPAP